MSHPSPKKRAAPAPLLEITAKEMARQHLAHQPEDLGRILGALDADARAAAVASIPAKLLLAIEQPLPRQLGPEDHIVIIGNNHESVSDLTYAAIAVKDLDCEVAGALDHWLLEWDAENTTHEARAKNSEHDGSPSLLLEDDGLDPLDSAIQKQLDEACKDEDYDDDGDGDEEGHAKLSTQIIDCLQGAFSAVGNSMTARYTRMPKLTIRFENL